MPDLKLIADRLEANEIIYALGGSGLLYSLGLIEAVNDWDITVECSRNELVQILNEFEWMEQNSGDYPFASKYRIQVPQFKIDFIGFFSLHSNSGIINLPVKQSTRWNGIKMGSPEVWYAAYKLMNRENKASLLYNYLKTNGANSEIIKQLLLNYGSLDDLRTSLLGLINAD
jgi:hypothetical protein